jgi:hypothetical protein
MWLSFLAYFPLPDNGPLKQLKHVAINFTARYTYHHPTYLWLSLLFSLPHSLSSFNSKCRLGFTWRDSSILPASNTYWVNTSWDPLIVHVNLSITTIENNGAWDNVLWETNVPRWEGVWPKLFSFFEDWPCESTFCPMLPDTRKSVAWFQGCQTSSACPDKNNTKMKVNMEHEWVDIERGKPKYSNVYLNCIHNFSSYLTGNTLRVYYQDQPVSAS